MPDRDRSTLPPETRLSLLEHELGELRDRVDREVRHASRQRGDHEARLRIVERLGFRLLAYALTGGAAGSTAAGLIAYYLIHHPH